MPPSYMMRNDMRIVAFSCRSSACEYTRMIRALPTLRDKSYREKCWHEREESTAQWTACRARFLDRTT